MTEQNDGPQWTAPGSAPSAPTGEPGRPKKKRRWLLYGGAALVVVIIIGAIASGSKKDEGTVAAAVAATASATTSVAPTTSQAVTTPSSSSATTSAALTTKTTPSSPASVAPPPPPPTTSEEPAYVPVETMTYTGSGDDVIDVVKPPADSLVLMTFTCAACDSNVALKSDYDLYVNEIGAYSGTRVLSSGYDTTSADTMTMEVTADADWTLVTSDLTTASLETSGVGDSVILVTDGTKAAVTHDGESNFAVKSFTSDYGDLLVNEIGPYTGTVRVRAPALIEITADGNWTFTTS